MANRILRLAFLDKKLSEEFKREYPRGFVEILAIDELEKRLEDFDVLFIPNEMVDGICASLEQCKRRPTIVITCHEKDPVPESYLMGKAEEVLVFPLRSADAVKAIRTHQNVKLLREMENINGSFPVLLEKIQEDICFAQKIQRRFVTDKFAPMGPLIFSSRYWCGLQAGGEYFDVFETNDTRKIGIFFSDSSSYALSTKVIAALSQGSKKQMNSSHPDQFVSAFMENLTAANEKPTDQLSFFYGVIDKLDFTFEFMAKGAVSFWVDNLEIYAPEAAPALEKWSAPFGSKISLNPGSRLMLFSDGFEGTLAKSPSNLLAKLGPEKKESKEVIQEFAFELRKHLEREEPASYDAEFPFPPQDCSILICDIRQRALRVAR